MGKPKTSIIWKTIQLSSSCGHCLSSSILSSRAPSPWASCVDYWSKLFQDTVGQFVPNYELKVRARDKEWMTREIRLMIKKRNRLHARFKRTRDQNHYAVFRNKRREINCLINKTRKNISVNLSIDCMTLNAVANPIIK